MNWLCFVAFVTLAVVSCAYAQQDCPWTEYVDVPGSEPHVERRYRSKEANCTVVKVVNDCPQWLSDPLSSWDQWENITGDLNGLQNRFRSTVPPCTKVEIEDRTVDCLPWSNWTEWENITDSPNELQNRSRSREHPCSGTQTEHFQPACPQKIVITVDTSSSVSRRRFGQLKAGVILMLKNADIEEPFTHVCVCYFGTTAEAIIPCSPFHNHTEVDRLINTSTPLSGRTRVSLGLECMYYQWLNCSRTGDHTVCVLIIDGNPSDPPNDDEELEATRSWIHTLQNVTCDEFVIFAIGNAFTNITEIESWADPNTQNNFFHTQSFAEFREFFEEENAFSTSCPIDGQWSAYGDWSDCSATCGGGRKFRVRTCTNPMPTEGGSDCDSADGDSQDEECNPNACPVDGEWSQWGTWSDCNATCGGGRRFSVRTCTDPMPSGGGSNCSSTNADSLDEECNPNPCPRDGEWSSWDPWGACSLTCGNGTRRRTRECANPPPIFPGANCPGSSGDSESCKVQECPIDGEWSPWATWQSCSETCGEGVRQRSRTCTNPAPEFKGNPCPDQANSQENCFIIACPGDGHWGSWDPWGACSHTCGDGTRERTRECNDPLPTFGGNDCVGSPDDSGNCNVQPCPSNGTWGSWDPWGACSRTCGDGTQERTRVCDNPPPTFGGLNCPGSPDNSGSCIVQPCPTPAPVRSDCEDCIIINGIGYKDLDPCWQYLQCYFDEGGEVVKAVLRTAAWGTFWNQHDINQDFPWNTDCRFDLCRNQDVGYRYPRPDNCRAYWQCGRDGRTSGLFCCDEGFRFDPLSQDCVFDSGITCSDACPPILPTSGGPCSQQCQLKAGDFKVKKSAKSQDLSDVRDGDSSISVLFV